VGKTSFKKFSPHPFQELSQHFLRESSLLFCWTLGTAILNPAVGGALFDLGPPASKKENTQKRTLNLNGNRGRRNTACRVSDSRPAWKHGGNPQGCGDAASYPAVGGALFDLGPAASKREGKQKLAFSFWCR